MDSQRDLSEKVLLYDPMFDARLGQAARKREKSKGRRIFLVAFIVVSVVASIYVSFFSLERDRYVYKENDDGIVLHQFSGREEDKILYIDYLRDKDGQNPDSAKPVTAVREYAVNCNEAIRYIYISESVEKIENTSFFTVKNLYGIFVEEGNEHYSVIDGVLYETENGKAVKSVLSPQKRAYALVAESLGAKLPESAEEIEGFIKYCEENAEAINKAYEEFRYTVTIPETVKILGQLSFAYSEKLKEIVLPEGLEEIEEMAMFRCWQMEKVDFPSALQKIGSDAFSYCGELKYIYIPANIVDIGHHAFYSCGAEQVNMELSEDEVKDKVKFGDDWAPEKRDTFMKRVPVLYNQLKEEM